MHGLKHTYLALGAAAALLITNANAQITGLGNGAGWTINTNGAFNPTIGGGDLHLTSGFGNSSSAFYNTAQNVTNFTASFLYTNNTPPQNDALSSPGDGMTFALQGSGPTALGIGGGGLGWLGIPNATGVALDTWVVGGPGTGLANTSIAYNYLSTGPVNLRSINPIWVTLSYSGNTLNETLLDTITTASFSTSYNVNIAGLVGGSTGFVGFTGGTGGAQDDQHVSNFTYNSRVPDTGSTLALLGLAIVGMAGLRRKLQSV